MRNATRFAAILALLPFPSLAADLSTAARAHVEDSVLAWAQGPEVLAALRASNTAHTSLTQPEIEALDLAWRAEITSKDQPTITPVSQNAISDLLRRKVDESKGVIVESFVMDNRGLNIATAALTSDYWQGDEDKFTETFPKGANAFHVSEVEFDESTQLYSVQVSFTLSDPETSEPLGAMTIAFNAETLE